jgi:hypothetical protein
MSNPFRVGRHEQKPRFPGIPFMEHPFDPARQELQSFFGGITAIDHDVGWLLGEG